MPALRKSGPVLGLAHGINEEAMAKESFAVDKGGNSACHHLKKGGRYAFQTRSPRRVAKWSRQPPHTGEGPPMPDVEAFHEFIRRIRAGDEEAAAQLVRHYEPLIRREVRINLEDRHLGQLFDSVDISQSVLLSFFVRSAAGQYDLQEPEQLLRLLVSMARNKLASAARHEHRQCRDQRRSKSVETGPLGQVADPATPPDEQAAGTELLGRLQQALSDEERQVAELRNQGLAWAAIATQLGGTPQARRMQLARALDRVAGALGLDLAEG
jgi:RNA polymerase sigma factor (sigma-70 family)